MSKTIEAARARGLRAAMSAAGGRLQSHPTVTSVAIKAAAVLALLGATGCKSLFPTWGPPAPPRFRARSK